MKFEVTENLLHAFAVVSGDHNPLHVDNQFARRSRYRERVAYGMLQIMMLSRCPALLRKGLVAIPRTVSGRFIEPVFVGDELSVSVMCDEADMSDECASFSFEVLRTHDGRVVTTGSVKVCYRGAQVKRQAARHSGKSRMPMPLGEPTQGDIDKFAAGDVTEFDFSVTQSAIAHAEEFLGVSHDTYLPNWLAVAMYSTLIGMRLPGRAATFLEFDIEFSTDVEVNASYRICAEVTHVSVGARVIMAAVKIEQEGAISVARGQVTAQVAMPEAAMPTMDEIMSQQPSLDLQGKIAIVTGASRGIGETIAKLLASQGCHVVVNYLRGEDDARRIVEEILDAGCSGECIKADVRDECQVRSMVESVVASAGTVDILVNNAVRDFKGIPASELTWQDIQADIDVAVRGAFNCCKTVIPVMKLSGGGKIISLGSIATDDPPPDQLKYVVSKSALVGLTRSFAAYLARDNVQVNMVVPNFVETDLVAHVQEGFRNKIASTIPMQRLATPLEVAQAVLFLASDLSNYTTGQRIMVTGGSLPYI